MDVIKELENDEATTVVKFDNNDTSKTRHTPIRQKLREPSDFNKFMSRTMNELSQEYKKNGVIVPQKKIFIEAASKWTKK